jgi:hypothetical protein
MESMLRHLLTILASTRALAHPVPESAITPVGKVDIGGGDEPLVSGFSYGKLAVKPKTVAACR